MAYIPMPKGRGFTPRLVKRIIENEEVTPTIVPVYDSRTGRILYDARKHPNGEEYEEAKKTWNRRVDIG